MNILFLDDDPNRQRVFQAYFPDADIVSTTNECIANLADCPWDIVCLDHDLGGETFIDSDQPNTGMEVVRWIEANSPKVGTFFVHSYNAPAATEMISRLSGIGYVAIRRQFGPPLLAAIASLCATHAEQEVVS